jgi:hypothetical protein
MYFVDVICFCLERLEAPGSSDCIRELGALAYIARGCGKADDVDAVILMAGLQR